MDSDKFEEIFNSECSCWIFVSKLHSILFGINENHTFKMKQHFGFPFKQSSAILQMESHKTTGYIGCNV